ncbi:MAG TPA: GIY-YIG nuclease family protein [Rhizomicrobium sp.]|jgi:hypothetical protein|nr:GIY-YIG nuclease family protein [Rhizomicrobium sp.]
MGKTIKIFLADSTPSGIMTAEIMNWTGHILVAPRSRIADLIKREEVKRTGVYLLFGEDPDRPSGTLVYVGEGDSVVTRLTEHNARKEFWDSCCVITSKDQNLTKAHVRYLESRIIGIIGEEGRARIENKTEPEFGLLPEADKSDMEEFLVQLQVLLPVLGIQFIQRTPRPSRTTEGVSASASSNTSASDVEQRERAIFGQKRPTEDGAISPIFSLDAKGVTAKAIEFDGQMVVLAGSEACEDELPSLQYSVKSLRDQLRQNGKLIQSSRPGVLRFEEDVAFSSPSAAAQAVVGTSRNGRTDWRVVDTGETYAHWQETQVRKAEEDMFASGRPLL